MEWVKGISGKVITAILVLAVFGGGLYWFELSHETRTYLLGTFTKIALWCAIVFILPYTLMALIARVARIGSNSAGMFLVIGVTAAELVLGGWLLRWHVSGSAAWVGVIAATITALAYNLLACDWIAERFE